MIDRSFDPSTDPPVKNFLCFCLKTLDQSNSFLVKEFVERFEMIVKYTFLADYYRQSVDESLRHRRSESETEDTQKSLYDEASGVYLGTEHRLSNVYDKSSGIYLGEEAPKVPKHDEGTGSGILKSLLEEKRQEMYFDEEQHGGSSMSLSEERSSGSNEEAEANVETPSLLERIKKVSIPAHLMPPPAETATAKKTSAKDDTSRGVRNKQTPRRENSPRLLARSESYPRSASNASSSRLSSDSEGGTGVHGNQLKTINLGPYEGTLGENSLISRILKSTSSAQGKM